VAYRWLSRSLLLVVDCCVLWLVVGCPGPFCWLLTVVCCGLSFVVVAARFAKSWFTSPSAMSGFPPTPEVVKARTIWRSSRMQELGLETDVSFESRVYAPRLLDQGGHIITSALSPGQMWSGDLRCVSVTSVPCASRRARLRPYTSCAPGVASRPDGGSQRSSRTLVV